MKPSEALALHRNEIRMAMGRFRASNPRVFGSVLHGTDGTDSDLDILIDPLPGATLFDLGGLQIALEELLGVRVYVRAEEDVSDWLGDVVFGDAEPV